MGRNGGGFCGVTWVLGIALALAVSSCDGSDHAGPGVSATSVREACIIWCEKQAESGCPDLAPREQCAETCDAAAAYLPCPQEYIATANCVAQKAAFTCSSSGDLEMRGCWTEMQPYLVCAACLPSANEDACDTCERTTCCAERKAYWSHPEFGSLFACTSACAEDAGSCVQACAARAPNLGRVLQALLECNQTCSTTCQ